MVNIQWYPGHMAKAKKWIKQNLSLVDVIIEVVDARIPDSSRNPDFEQIFSSKPRVIVFNKRDMADAKATGQWINYYMSRGFGAVTANGALKQGIKNIIATVKVQVEPVMQALESKGRRRRSIRAMVVGIPNVGKSTIINAMMDKAIAKTANKPGVTRGPQWVRVREELDLLDTPGLLWPKFDDFETGFKLAVTGAISDLVFSVEEVAKKLLDYLVKNNPQAIMDRFKIKEITDNPDHNLEMIGKNRGLLAPGGIVKIDQTCLMLLQEFRNGKLGRYTLELPDNNQEDR